MCDAPSFLFITTQIGSFSLSCYFFEGFFDLCVPSTKKQPEFDEL